MVVVAVVVVVMVVVVVSDKPVQSMPHFHHPLTNLPSAALGSLDPCACVLETGPHHRGAQHSYLCKCIKSTDFGCSFLPAPDF